MSPKTTAKKKRQAGAKPPSRGRRAVARRKTTAELNDITERKRAEGALRESEEQFRLFVEHAPAAIAMLDRDMCYLAVSRRWMDDYGLTGSIIGQSHYDVFPEIPARWKEVHRRSLAGEVLSAAADPFIRADGSTQWLKWEVRPWYRGGELGGILIATEDVTDREQAKNALREREALSRAFLENSATIAWMKDEEGRHVYLSPNFERRFAFRPTDWRGKTDFELWPRQVAEVFRANDEAVLRDNRVIEVVEEAQSPDGSRSWWLNHKFPYQDSAGKRYVGGLGVEITDRKQAEEALRESEAQLRLALDASGAGLWYWDLQTGLVRVDDNYRTLYGYVPGQRIDYAVWEARVAPDDRERLATRAEKCLRDGSEWREDFRILHPEQGERWLGGLGRVVRNEQGSVIGMTGINFDITERKQAGNTLRHNEQELRHHQAQLEDLTSKLLTAQERERKRMARDLHDDISQRLAALVIDVASLEQQPPVLQELVPQALVPIRQQLERLSDDVHNLAYTLHPSLLEHAGLQPAVEDHIQQVMKRSGLRIVLKARDVPASLSLDRSTCLFRVLQESLQNIVKHANATEVTVKLSGSSNGIGLSVTDNGRGFDASDKSAHQKGLGLISMQERLRLLHGFLRVHSRPADGTKVCAWIPYQEHGA
jgi:PAS domain S-box-containing protein